MQHLQKYFNTIFHKRNERNDKFKPSDYLYHLQFSLTKIGLLNRLFLKYKYYNNRNLLYVGINIVIYISYLK